MIILGRGPGIVILEQMAFKALKDKLLGHLLRDMIIFLNFVRRRQVIVIGLLRAIEVVISDRIVTLTH